jgi:hypothetical protein
MRFGGYLSLPVLLPLVLAATLVSDAIGAYSAHQNDQDVKIFQSLYAYTQSTKLDDCSLCHPGARTRRGNPKGAATIATSPMDCSHLTGTCR